VNPVRLLLCLALSVIVATAARIVVAQSAPASPADPQAVWGALAKPAFDAAKFATVSNLVIERDRIRITLESGTFHFTQPVNGMVFGAVFHGSGHLQMSAPNPRESQQLQLFIKQDGVNLAFSDMVLAFTDKTFDEFAGKVQWGGPTPGDDGLYASRIQANEDLGFAFLPRLFKERSVFRRREDQ
jgi:hypothetical protein